MRVIAAAVAILVISPVCAAEKDVISTYNQLLGEANSRIANLSGQAADLHSKLDEANHEIELLKKKNEPTVSKPPAVK